MILRRFFLFSIFFAQTTWASQLILDPQSYKEGLMGVLQSKQNEVKALNKSWEQTLQAERWDSEVSKTLCQPDGFLYRKQAEKFHPITDTMLMVGDKVFGMQFSDENAKRVNQLFFPIEFIMLVDQLKVLIYRSFEGFCVENRFVYRLRGGTPVTGPYYQDAESLIENQKAIERLLRLMETYVGQIDVKGLEAIDFTQATLEDPKMIEEFRSGSLTPFLQHQP